MLLTAYVHVHVGVPNRVKSIRAKSEFFSNPAESPLWNTKKWVLGQLPTWDNSPPDENKAQLLLGTS